MRTAPRIAMVASAGAAIAAAAVPGLAPAAQQPPAEFDGRIVSVNREAKRFRINDLEKGVRRIKVTRGTRYERVNGFAGVRRGAVLEVVARRKNGAWVAVEVERSGRDDREDRSGRDD